ncbi:GNAT family N-acyltransferase [Nocardia implantans]|uniref:GNAT family N-acyltransferase n=1 Tax=Nocardia implantans TaxID=3108168 RepID=A0ABU6AT83_9NOCA|nr:MULTISPECIES: GNAT family N-acyltransferase [unclassified Nocardia]MBF6190977.1 GNAT family N-acetyltransferase [Nocardia beijingensis]MEA3528969.1 GNAT family N-acyltransferase [Nocardia sp. CDC192]MEB3510634.1 GNAT family N-acyltransferase [Nocardia sp. CDC186]
MTISSVLTAPARPTDSGEGRSRYSLVVSSDLDHRIAAQRLRYNVFANEPGFQIPDDGTGLDADRFDEHCDHMLVRDDAGGEFVGCYRMLPPDKVAAAGGYYTATEFDLTQLDPEGMRIVEMGRACVVPDHRNGSVLTLMWAGILHYIQLTGYEWVMGCVSVPMRDTPADPPGVNVRGVRDMLLGRHASDPERRVHPYNPVTVDGKTLDELTPPGRPKLPPLVRGYLRLGAEICGEPAHDPAFAVADFVALLGLNTINTRYLERLQDAAASFDGGR